MKHLPLLFALSLAATPALAQPASPPEVPVSLTGQELQRLIQAEALLDPVLQKLIKAQQQAAQPAPTPAPVDK